MKAITAKNRRRTFLFTAFLLAAAAPMSAQTATTAAPPPPATEIKNSERLEVEIVEAHDQVGIPAELRRKAGRFILLVANRSRDVKAWFVVDAAPAVSAAATENDSSAATTVAVTGAHLLTIGSGQFQRRHHSAAIFDAPPGTYQLKYGATGKVLCTLVIE